MATTPEVNEFITRLQHELREKQLSLLDADFLRAVETREVTREQIREWAKTFYAATRNGRVGLGNFYANSPDDPEVRREIAENLYEEETGRISGVGKCHMDVFQDLLAVFDIGRDEIRRLDAEFRDHQPRGCAIPPEEFFAELCAYGLTVESPNAEFCVRIHRALRENYGFAEQHLTWFSMHASLDAIHGEEFRKYAARAAEYPRGLEYIREKTLAQSQGVKTVWDGFGRWRSV